MLDLIIAGGTIVDGSGAPRYRADIGIKDGLIVKIGNISDPAQETIDATGRIVCPGFIDVHTHYDAQVFWDPTLSPSCYHGVTTIFGGFCGFSIAPLSKESGAYLMPMLARVEGMPLSSLEKGVPWNWSSFAEYLSRFEGTLAINAGFLAGHSAIRRYVMGGRALGGLATSAEIEQMKDLLRESIRGGALGFSSTISPTHCDADGNPVPSRHATRNELLQLFKVVSEFEGTLAEMLPGIDFNPDTYEILTQVSLASGRPVNWNALSLHSGNAEEVEQIKHKLGASDYARERGAEVIALTVSKTPTVRINLLGGLIFDAIPGWEPLFQLSPEDRMRKLEDADYRNHLKTAAAAMSGILKDLFNWPRMTVMEVFSDANKACEGRMLGEIAAERGRDVFDVFAQIAVVDQLRTVFLPEYPKETAEMFRARAKLWMDSRTIVGASDAGAHLDMIDTFTIPTVLLAYGVREHQALSLEQGIQQLTQKPAEMMGLLRRGQLKQGWHADIVVFDLDSISPGRVHTRRDLPGGGERLYAEAEGIYHVVVNGREIIRDRRYLGVPAGIVLRPGKDTYTVPIPAHRKAS